ncbi:MAG: pilus assembly protein [Bacilli bacterium]|nr:pilus assembly protein [Bacilli bacterium]
MNRKGQALVEFVLILPIFIMILFVIYDFGNIFSNKSKLENISSDIVDMYNNNITKVEIIREYSNLDITFDDYKDKYTKIIVKKNVDILTPGLDRILGKKYEIVVERIVSNA